MKTRLESRWLAAVVLAAAMVAAAPANAEMSATELAKLAQNPVGNLVSVPFQNNTNFNVGPQSGTQNILNIQPVYPIEVNKDWNVITRTILPVIWQPEFAPGQGSSFGLGDIQLSAFVSPASPGPGGLIWGAGAIMQAPTNTDDTLGNKNWGMGPTAVVLKVEILGRRLAHAAELLVRATADDRARLELLANASAMALRCSCWLNSRRFISVKISNISRPIRGKAATSSACHSSVPDKK